MTARIFEYKGYIGVDIDMKDGKFINDPFGPNQLGCVISTKEIQISPGAINVIKAAKREGGSFSNLMLTRHSEGGDSSIAIMGGGKVNLGKNISIGRDCTLDVLDDCEVVEVEVPEDYKAFVDNKTPTKE